MSGEEYERTMAKIYQQEQEAAATRDERDMREAVKHMEHLDKTEGASLRLRAELQERASQMRPLAAPGPQPEPEPPPEWDRRVWIYGWLGPASAVIAALQEQLPGWRIVVERTGRRNNGKR